MVGLLSQQNFKQNNLLFWSFLHYATLLKIFWHVRAGTRRGSGEPAEWGLHLETSIWLKLAHHPRRQNQHLGMGIRSSGDATTRMRGPANAEQLGALRHQNTTPTNDHSQNDEMVRTFLGVQCKGGWLLEIGGAGLMEIRLYSNTNVLQCQYMYLFNLQNIFLWKLLDP